MIITTNYYGELGVYALNRRLRERHLGPSDDNWLPGERVVQRRSGRWKPVGQDDDDAEVLLVNGDRGIVRSVAAGAVVVDYSGTLVELTGMDIMPGRAVIEPDYALTVHRAQGSQAGTVVVVVDPDQPKMWDDKAIGYTAVTRAAEHLVVYGDLQVLAGDNEAKPKMERRYTALPKRIEASYGRPSTQRPAP
jgi:exodeoxyribonuclease V alpha subunit